MNRQTALAVCVVFVSSLAVRGQESLRFEAEEIAGPKTAWNVDKFSETKWNLWSTDKDAAKKWSGGVVLQSPRVLQDRKSPADGAPPLHVQVRNVAAGQYFIEIGGVGRPMGISLDGQMWRKIDYASRTIGPVTIDGGTFEMWVDDRYASATNPGSCYFDYLVLTPLPDPNRKPRIRGYAQQRVTEQLDRGLIAIPSGGNRVYVGWRLRSDDPATIAFNVYRQVGAAPRAKLNRSPLTKTTDFVDTHAVLGQENKYTVVTVRNGREQDEAATTVTTPTADAQHFQQIKLHDDITFQKCGIADLNGDGRYDYVIKQPNANVDPYVNYWKSSPSTYKIETYLSDGTFLWSHDLGWSIEQGIWYSPMVVYDLDGDGRAEVCCKAGEGDPRDADGRVQSGAEYLLILDGMTGRERIRVPWPPREDFPAYNYASRNQMCVAYLDGKTPCLIVVRGTYNVIKVVAYEFHHDKLRTLWQWAAKEEGGRFAGQGAHSMHTVDIDGDGRDEIFLGSAVLDDNGVGLWATGLGHPDHHYVGDIDPAHPGLEVYYGIETRQRKNGCCLVDARTGKVLWGLERPTRHVHSYGMCADLDPTAPGLECYSSDTDTQKKSKVRWLFDARGNILRDDLDWGFGLRTVYWDADPQRELVRGARIFKYRGNESWNVLNGSVVGFADVLGDWREELIVSARGSLRIYTTTIPATSRRVCLMQDPLYRMDVCIQAMGYTQCPMTTK